jgi:hypothetical protein
MKLKDLAVIIKADNGKVYQILLTKSQEIAIIDHIQALHGGSIRVSDEPIESIDITENENKRD